MLGMDNVLVLILSLSVPCQLFRSRAAHL